MENPSAEATQPCPFCKEEVKAGALRCKHCEATIPAAPSHGGVCPFCREAIHAEATRCKHCKANLVGSGRAAPPPKVRRRQQSADMTFDGGCHGCEIAFMEESTMWVLTSCDAQWCYYQPGGYV